VPERNYGHRLCDGNFPVVSSPECVVSQIAVSVPTSGMCAKK
jgi:hypothetical protein